MEVPIGQRIHRLAYLECYNSTLEWKQLAARERALKVSFLPTTILPILTYMVLRTRVRAIQGRVNGYALLSGVLSWGVLVSLWKPRSFPQWQEEKIDWKDLEVDAGGSYPLVSRFPGLRGDVDCQDVEAINREVDFLWARRCEKEWEIQTLPNRRGRAFLAGIGAVGLLGISLVQKRVGGASRGPFFQSIAASLTLYLTWGNLYEPLVKRQHLLLGHYRNRLLQGNIDYQLCRGEEIDQNLDLRSLTLLTMPLKSRPALRHVAENAPALEKLTLCGRWEDADLVSVNRMHALSTLDLSRTPRITGSCIQNLPSSLTELHLHKLAVKPSIIPVQRLERLVIKQLNPMIVEEVRASTVKLVLGSVQKLAPEHLKRSLEAGGVQRLLVYRKSLVASPATFTSQVSDLDRCQARWVEIKLTPQGLTARDGLLDG